MYDLGKDFLGFKQFQIHFELEFIGTACSGNILKDEANKVRPERIASHKFLCILGNFFTQLVDILARIVGRLSCFDPVLKESISRNLPIVTIISPGDFGTI